ncbi:hypothetical protein MBLNU230_g5406t1 [Neophaeotheca triangularis]
MAYWIPSSIQKRLLRYALSRTGLLEDKAIDLADLDITLGRQNVVELKNVGLNIQKLSKLAQLPPELRIEAARALSLKLTVPADIYQSSIVAEVDGLELSVRVEEDGKRRKESEKAEKGESGSSRTSEHRKSRQGVHSPRAHLQDAESHLPTTQDLARSFLHDEPLQERMELEASVAANGRSPEESTTSDGTDGGDIGTGTGVGLPGFLAGFLQGIVDRLQLKIRNVHAELEMQLGGDDSMPLALSLRVENAGLDATQGDDAGYRKVFLSELAFDLMTDAVALSNVPEAPFASSPPAMRSSTHSRMDSTNALVLGDSTNERPTPTALRQSHCTTSEGSSSLKAQVFPATMQASPLNATDRDHFAEAGDGNDMATSQQSLPDMDIRPGEDNLSFAARRSQGSTPSVNLWDSVASDEDLPDSLLFEPRRPSAQSTPQTTQESPPARRTPRSVSPYARNLQSPRSWPRLDRSPKRNRSQQQDHDSWPTIERDRHGGLPSLTPGHRLEKQDDSVDNKNTAFEYNESETSDDSADMSNKHEHAVEDMANSRYFSHEEAESMYMSAMTQGHSPRVAMPGQWGSDDSPSERSLSPVVARREGPRKGSTSPGISNHTESTVQEEVPIDPPLREETLVETPRAESLSPKRTEPAPLPEDKRVATRLLHIDTMSVNVPNRVKVSSSLSAKSTADINRQASTPATPGGIPGTFSTYSERSERRGQTVPGSSDAGSVLLGYPQNATSVGEMPIRVEIGTVDGSLDLALGKVMYGIVTKLTQLLKGNTSTSESSNPSTAPGPTSMLKVAISNLLLRVCHDAQRSTDHQEGEHDLVTLKCADTFFAASNANTEFGVGRLTLTTGGRTMLTFSRDQSMQSSVVIRPDTPDLKVDVSGGHPTTSKYPSTQVQLSALPVILDIDIPVLEDVFSSFGGLSGILELGNSVLSDTTAIPSPRKPPKGVRFAGDKPLVAQNAELKAHGRIEGAAITLRASACAVKMRSTAIKFVHRAERSGISTNQIRIEGPQVPQGNAVPFTIDTEGVKFDYVNSAVENDLERLLSLLTPRKDKYDNDDDIMIDTLVRQRRKGAVARLTVDKLRVNVTDNDSLGLLQDLGTEMAQVSAVAKYFPEDERPGLMTLARVKDAYAQVPVNDRFGRLTIRARDLNAAHVGLPALLALAVSGVRVSDDTDSPLIHAVSPLDGHDDLPMIMARMLGNEAEPTVKVKFYNICLEYSVSTILALTDKQEQPDVEKLVAGMAKSVAALVPASSPAENTGADESPVPTIPPASSSKRTNVNLLLHDCTIGLTPQVLQSKALLVITDARASMLVPPGEMLSASLELHRAAVFLTDNANNAIDSAPSSNASTTNNTATTPRLALALAKQGYVSVGSIISAKLEANVGGGHDSNKSVELDFTNKLFLLETCADSTRTLIATLGALAPPSTPSKQPQYLTEPMTIQDMLASFSGEAVEKPERTPETLFDIEEENDPADELEAGLAMSSDLDDDLLAESEMTSSLYGPVSGMLTGVDAPVDDDGAANDFRETAESLLEEEDPFEMTSSPTEMKLNDHQLIGDLNAQGKPALSEEPVEIECMDIEDLGTAALGSEQAALGTKYRFGAPVSKAVLAISAERKDCLPFKLKVHDCHVIWNIHDGYDWQRTQDGITDAVEQIEKRAEEKITRRRQSRNDPEDEESVIGDCLFNSIYIGVPSNQDAQNLRRQINRGIDPNGSEIDTESLPVSATSRPTTYSAGGRPVRQRQQRRLRLERSREHKVAFELKGVSADILVFNPNSGEVQSSVDVRLKDFEIFDKIPTSTFHKFLTCMNNERSTREMSKPMIHLQLSNVKTLQEYSATEIVMRVSILPLRLHVDQDTLDFITRFFEFKDPSVVTPESTDQPFLQRVEIDTVDLCLHYKPKTVDYAGIRSGHTTEFMNFVNLEACDIRLRHAIVYGLQGFEPLHKTLNDVWMPDVKRNQLPRILAGLAPVRGIVNLGSGMRDVVAIPVREYRRDGRIVRNIQKGAFQFAKTTTSELARLGAKVAMGTQNMLSNAETFLGPSPSNSPYGRAGSSEEAESRGEHEHRAISAYADQPVNIFSGLRSARQRLEHDLLTAKDAFIAVQGEVLESRDPTSAAAAVVKHGPTVILRPVIGASRAVGTTLMGLGNQVDRGNVSKMEDVSFV